LPRLTALSNLASTFLITYEPRLTAHRARNDNPPESKPVDTENCVATAGVIDAGEHLTNYV
jgi:hypothetical protein